MNDLLINIGNILADKNILLSPATKSPLLHVVQSPEESNMIANAISGKVSNEIHLIKGKILPLRKEMLDKIADLLESSKPVDWEIIEHSLYVELEELNDYDRLPVNGFKNTTLPATPASISEPDNIMDFTKHSNSDIYNITEKIVINYNEYMVRELWKKYLTNISDNEVIANLRTKVLDNIDDVVMLHNILNSKTMEENIPYMLNTGVDAVHSLRKYIKACINKYNSLSNINYRSDLLIENVVVEKKEIHVWDVVYDEALKKGLKPDAVIGYAIENGNNNNHMDIEEMVLKNDYFVKVRSNNLDALRIMEINKNTNKLKAVYKMAVNHTISNLPEDLEPHLTTDDIPECTEKLLTSLDTVDLNDRTYVCNLLLGDVLFKDTNYKTFTTYIYDIAKMSPNIEPSRAANLACVSLVLDYLLKQTNDNQMNND